MTIVFADVKTAFMQGKAAARKSGPLYSELPPRGLPGVPAGSLIELVASVYGQNDAPLNWYETVVPFLVEECGMTKRLLDERFLFLIIDGTFHGCIAIVVDDLTMGSRGPEMDAVYAKLNDLFVFGKWTLHEGTYSGKHVKQYPEAMVVSYIQHADIVANEREIPIPKDLRARGEETLLPEYLADEARSQVGSAGYNARESRSDVAGDVGFAQGAWPHPNVGDLIGINHMIRKLVQYPVTLRFQRCVNPRWIMSSDAGWANTTDLVADTASEKHLGQGVEQGRLVGGNYRTCHRG